MDRAGSKSSGTSKQIILLLVSIVSLSILVRAILPCTLLRLLPVISSIISLQFAYDEYSFLSCWTKHQYRAQANALLPLWFSNWAPGGTKIVFGSFTLSLAGGIANATAIWNSTGSQITLFFYMAGTFFATCHLLIFGPKALGLLAKIRRNEADAPSMASLELWLSMHVTRSFVADLPAVLCFVTALLTAIECVV